MNGGAFGRTNKATESARALANKVVSIRNELARVNKELNKLQAKKTSLQTKLAEAKQQAEDDLGNV